ncbi:hypothetical protein E4K66_01765 [Bradyrhizobium frederickii]|uniref:Uncharacterized protein n=1 Tax=Bradyrhizobium frederickii TaxID=2560054 RepID=A0A4Y9LJA4_9BRAD|nr:hypothetical protein [Bradyrhizobium frederickii]TFV42737.1 hypothetical protein E4K66_01765 [Bradyrhizobium frederickii]
MDDLHQVNTIIATTICAFFKGHSDAQIGTEEAKLLAKQITQALEQAGLEISAANPTNAPP